ncbi:MAG: hypothetical protein V2A73_06815 [Pseudomonadota bacterium]
MSEPKERRWWKESSGATAEHAEAEKRGIPRYYWEADQWDILPELAKSVEVKR